MCECASGVLATLWPRCAGLQNARGGAPGALQSHYGVSGYEHFTAAVDLLQTQVGTWYNSHQFVYGCPPQSSVQSVSTYLGRTMKCVEP